MTHKIILFQANDPQVNAEAMRTLSELPNLNVRTASDSEWSRTHFLLPFIEREDGIRHYGLHGIRAFVRRQLQGTSM
jgi:hypothetical protein